MNRRESLEALQACLLTARRHFEAGDRTAALEAVDSALAIDPDFLAAHLMRDRILAPPPSAVPVSAPSNAASTRSAAREPRPLVSAESYARFEERTRRRRVDRRVDAARVAIDRRRLTEAAAAISEIRQLDGNLPELPALEAALVEARQRQRRPRNAGWWLSGPLVASLAIFAGLLLLPSWLADLHSLGSHALPVGHIVSTAPSARVSGLMVSSPGTEALDTLVVATAGTTTLRERVAVENAEVVSTTMPTLPTATEAPPRIPRAPVPTNVPVLVATDSLPPATPPAPVELRTPVEPRPTAAEPRVAVVDAPVNRPPPAAPLAAAPATNAVPATNAAVTTTALPPAVDDTAQVRGTLQQYRRAYDRLDAQSAHGVWPAVNQAALARAFDGLSSQSLTFDDCDVRLQGDAALATCRGSARYVPKVGSREPRIEPRVWNFTLKRQGPDWKIETARTER